MKLSVHPVAEQDVAEAAAFYEREGSPALAARFISEFKRIGQLLLERPEIGSPRSRGRRGFQMSTFPYTVIYRAGTDALRILVVKHHRRHPGHGGSRR